jgi:hypothetical protein
VLAGLRVLRLVHRVFKVARRLLDLFQLLCELSKVPRVRRTLSLRLPRWAALVYVHHESERSVLMPHIDDGVIATVSGMTSFYLTYVDMTGSIAELSHLLQRSFLMRLSSGFGSRELRFAF